MAIHETQWSPDTCGCVLRYFWDDAVPDATRTHTFQQSVVVCPIHQTLNVQPGQGHYNAILEENQRKNVALGLGQGIKATLDLSLVAWSFDPLTRILTVSAGSQLTTQQKSSLQTQVNQRFGAAKVVIT